jgi:hypothetical protein
MTERLQKITFGDMRDSGVHGVVVYSDYRCAPRAATLTATMRARYCRTSASKSCQSHAAAVYRERRRGKDSAG